MGRPSPSDLSWLRLLPSLAASAALLAGIIALSLVTGDDRPASIRNNNPGMTQVVSAPAAGGGGPELYPEPRRVTEGDWTPVTWDDIPGPNDKVPEERVYYQVGEVINGIRITDGGGNGGSACPDAVPSEAPSTLKVTYLPPNTFEMAKPQMWQCGGGAVAAVMLRYSIGERGLAFIDVNYARLAGEPQAVGTGPVEPIVVNGQAAVAVHPAIFKGKEIGQGSVVIVTKNGAIEVIGSSIPMAETIKIAQGIRCEAC